MSWLDVDGGAGCHVRVVQLATDTGPVRPAALCARMEKQYLVPTRGKGPPTGLAASPCIAAGYFHTPVDVFQRTSYETVRLAVTNAPHVRLMVGWVVVVGSGLSVALGTLVFRWFHGMGRPALSSAAMSTAMPAAWSPSWRPLRSP